VNDSSLLILKDKKGLVAKHIERKKVTQKQLDSFQNRCNVLELDIVIARVSWRKEGKPICLRSLNFEEKTLENDAGG
jgi:hypothetical protein